MVPRGGRSRRAARSRPCCPTFRFIEYRRHAHDDPQIPEADSLARLFATTPLSMLTQEAHEEGEHTLKRSLGPVNLITLGIGAVIGAGIFVLTGQAAAIH